MIDFVSTRESTPAAHLDALHIVAAYIAHHIEQACAKPTKEEQLTRKNVSVPSRAALKYLFDAGSKFEEHAALIGSDADCMREALLSPRPLHERGAFTYIQRRTLQLRYYWWTAEKSH